MSNKEIVHTLRDDSDTQELQKHIGCMNGIFQIFDRRYLLGQRRHGHNQKKLPQGQSDNGETEVRSVKEKASKVVTKEDRVSVELPRNSFSSSSSSTAMSSSLDYSKRVQTDVSSSCQSVISESCSSPSLHRKKPNLSIQSPDIRDVVKDSMTREPRVVSIKHVAKDERVGTAMKHIDSPRPFPPQKDIQYDRIKQNLRELKETARFSCDGRDLRYQSKPNMKIKELPRLSLDSRQGYISNAANDPMSNKRPSSSVVARLMGLEALTGDESKTLKTNTCSNEEPVLNSRSARKEDKLKHECTSVSPKVQKPQRGVKVNHVITRIPLEPAPWKQEGGGRGLQKPLFKIKDSRSRAEQASRSIYDEIERRLTENEYKTAGKDIRALKQILEAMQKAKKRLENKEHVLDNISIDDRLSQKVDQPVSPTISQQKVKHTDARKESVGKNRLKNPTLRDRKVAGRPPSTSNFREHCGAVSPRLQRSKNSMHGPSSDWIRTKKQPGMQRTTPGSTNRHSRAKSIDLLQDSSETRNLSQQSDAISFQSENESEVTSNEWAQEVNSPFRPKENHKQSNITERLTEEKSTVDLAKHSMEQPSPVSVLDAFYTEDTPSPVKKTSNAFTDVENLHFEETQDQSRINKLANSTKLDQYSDFNSVKLESIKNLVHQIELLSTHSDDATVNHTVKSSCEGEIRDHEYVEEIILASGCLKDLDRTTAILQLHPTVSLINPRLFHVLEKTKACTELTEDGYNKNFMRPNIRRKMVFDTVNDVLCNKLSMLGPFGSQNGRVLNEDKLLKELCSGIDGLQNKPEIAIYDEDDEVTNIINADVNKRSQDWDEYCQQVPGVVLDIERLIFKDLISEVVNFQVTTLQDWPVKPHCRRLFTM